MVLCVFVYSAKSEGKEESKEDRHQAFFLLLLAAPVDTKLFPLPVCKGLSAAGVV